MKLSDIAPTVAIGRRKFLQQSLLGASLAGISQVAHAATPKKMRVRIWCEGGAPKPVYPHDVDGAIAEALGRRAEFTVTKARLDESDAGLSDAALDATDTLIWWGRLRHHELPDHRAKAIAARVKAGKLGFVALHASCLSKPFLELMGSNCELGGFREDGRPERIEVKDPNHPIVQGVTSFTIPRSSMFAEPFRVPAPEKVVMVSTFDRGETFRSGLTWSVGKGRVAYFRPGHDGFPIFFHPAVRKIVANAAIWASAQA